MDRVDAKGNKRKGKLLRQSVSSGYPYVNLRINNKTVFKRVHQLVAEAFLDKPEYKCEVHHIDGNKTNNNVNNLEWCSHLENTHYIWY